MVIKMDELRNKKILIVDDEKEIFEMLEGALFKEGFYHTYKASDCREAIRIINEQRIALCVLDINLPDGNGFTLFEDIRKITTVPVIFLTARGESEDKLHGLTLGADDYMVKPFLIKEFILRVIAILKRTYNINETQTTLRLSDRTVDFETAEVILKNKKVPITAKEFMLLKKLHENKNRIVTFDALCLFAWGDAYYGYENTLMVHIRRLREKIEENPSKPKHLITVKGIGYKLVIDNEKNSL